MQFIDFQNRLSVYLVFSLKDVSKIIPGFNRIQLDRWEKKGYLKKYLLEKIASLNFEDLAKDVEPLLFDPRDKKKVSLFREFVEQNF